MLDKLRQIEDMLPALLKDEGGWRSKKIDYSPPVVDRLYRDIDLDGVGHRIYLHRIYECERAFFHPHPWPSAIRVIGGLGSSYEMGVGFGSNERHDGPPLAARLIVKQGMQYEMCHPDGWHYVKIIGRPSVSVMVSGPVWERPGGAPRTDKYDFRALDEQEARTLFNAVRAYYKLATLEPLPDYGDLMTLAEFIDACEGDAFIDDDGSGCFATATHITNRRVRPSEVVGRGLEGLRERGEYDPAWTHVVWFNR